MSCNHSMKLIVCICDYSKRRHYYNLPQKPRPSQLERGGRGKQLDTENKQEQNRKPAKNNNNIVRRLQLELDAIEANYMLRELLQQKVLHHCLLQQRGVQLIYVALRPPERHSLDYKWARMLAQTIWRHMELEHLMCWLSTLGGGYSALGDQYAHCAETAGQISLHQLRIGLRLGDSMLQARCKLFYSISLIQRGQLRRAKHLIRAQYQFAGGQQDQRLQRMTQGIWQRLCFAYKQRLNRKFSGNIN